MGAFTSTQLDAKQERLQSALNLWHTKKLVSQRAGTVFLTEPDGSKKDNDGEDEGSKADEEEEDSVESPEPNDSERSYQMPK